MFGSTTEVMGSERGAQRRDEEKGAQSVGQATAGNNKLALTHLSKLVAVLCGTLYLVTMYWHNTKSFFSSIPAIACRELLRMLIC
jgi:hypothetical protein